MNYLLPLQKDLEIHRQLVNRPTGKFDYLLFHKGEHIATRKDNREMTFGAVYVDRNGDIYLDSLRANKASFENYILEDNRTYILPVIIKS